MPKISIGFPVYNGEDFLYKKLESILTQTYENFELIISNNGSTDLTSKICKEFVAKDNRIKYFEHSKTEHPQWNFNFVLEKATAEYFVFTAADDIMTPEFISKIMNILTTNPDSVGCMCRVKTYGEVLNNFKKINYALKRIGVGFRPLKLFPVNGTYNQRLRLVLKEMPWTYFYGIFKTDAMKKSFVQERMAGFDGAVIMNLIKYGNISIIDEPLFNGYAQGGQSKGMISLAKEFNKDRGITSKIFPYYPLSIYIKKNIELKNFMKNFDQILRLNFDAALLLLVAIIQKIGKKNS